MYLAKGPCSSLRGPPPPLGFRQERVLILTNSSWWWSQSIGCQMKQTCIFVNFQQVLREVKVLANLSHSNVVGYHAAWLEYVTTDTVGVALPSKWSACACIHQLEIVATYNIMFTLEICYLWQSKMERRILTALLSRPDCAKCTTKNVVKCWMFISFIVVDVHKLQLTTCTSYRSQACHLTERKKYFK